MDKQVTNIGQMVMGSDMRIGDVFSVNIGEADYIMARGLEDDENYELDDVSEGIVVAKGEHTTTCLAHVGDIHVVFDMEDYEGNVYDIDLATPTWWLEYGGDFSE